MSCLAIVTARAGSKGVPRKNLRVLGGRPLVAWSVDAGVASTSIDVVVVSTDSPEIRDAAAAAGAEGPFLRPAELATDDAQQEDAVLHAMDWYEERQGAFDLVCLLEPTSPFRRAVSLERGFALLDERADAEAVFSVARCEHSPLYARPLPADGLMRDWVDDDVRWANRQELPDLYRPVGAVVVSRWHAFRRERTFLHDRTLALVVDEIEAVEIDTPLDFALAETIADRRLHEADTLD